MKEPIKLCHRLYGVKAGVTEKNTAGMYELASSCGHQRGQTLHIKFS